MYRVVTAVTVYDPICPELTMYVRVQTTGRARLHTEACAAINLQSILKKKQTDWPYGAWEIDVYPTRVYKGKHRLQ